jgi:hypothetical protein
MNEVNLQIVEILRNFGSKERFIGVVDHYDLAGTTAYIRSKDYWYLAFLSDLPPGLKPGAVVSFRRDQMRAKDILNIEPEKSNGS